MEIVEEIKGKTENPVGIQDVFNDRLVIKSKNPKFKDFAPLVMSKYYVQDYERVKNFKVYEDDVWLCGFPRSGTTLTQELLWLAVNKFDFEGAMATNTYNRAQWFDLFNVTHKMQGVELDYPERMPRPRIFKTHAPVQFLPDQLWTVKPRIVHIERDVKDVAISYFYLRKNSWYENLTMEEHFEEILADNAWFMPYREHILNYKNLPDYPNILYVTYEELVGNMAETVKKILSFLGKTIDDDTLTKLVDHLSFDKMKKNKMTNIQEDLEEINRSSNEDRPTDTFIRKGIVGDHKNQMSEEMIKRFDKWMAESGSLKPGYN